MSFYVGQKVVCVRGGHIPGRGYHTESVPVRGGVYTVRGLDTERLDGHLGLYLEEIRNPELDYADGFGEASFMEVRFRPLDDLEQQLERIESEPVEEPEYA